jgi:hypothetical protein
MWRRASRQKTDVFYARETYLIQRRLHISVPNARVNQEINPLLGPTLKPISDFGWQSVCGDSFVAKIHLSATRHD